MANQWTDRQKDAIYLNGQNILVSAAAGSGKTAVLVQRILEKITSKEHPVDADRLVIVTFTRAAAAEMKQRLRSALEKLCEENPDNELLIRQQTLINNAQITTIDSFCLNIVRNYFVDVDIDPGFRTADEGELKLLEHDVLMALMEEYYTKEDEDFQNLIDAYATGKDDRKVMEIISNIYHFARSCPWEEQWYNRCEQMYDIKDKEDFENHLCVVRLWDDIKQQLKDYSSRYSQMEAICQSEEGPLTYLDCIESEHQDIKELLQAKTFGEFLEKIHQIHFERLPRAKKDVDEEKKDYVKTCRDRYKTYITKTIAGKILSESYDTMYDNIVKNAPYARKMLELAKTFSTYMQKEKRERNIIDFNDMEHMALNILVKIEDGKKVYTQVADTLAQYYEEILIDEYQDSNMLQEEILTAVSRQRLSDKSDNIYMVGDVKQSIYKFRMACPELFMDKYNCYKEVEQINEKNVKGNNLENSRLQEGIKIELQANFRSRSNVLYTANDVFKRIMHMDYCGIEYDENAQLNQGMEYPASPEQMVVGNRTYQAVGFDKKPETEVLVVAKNEDERESSILEATRVCNMIEELVHPADRTVHVVYDKTITGGYRPIRYSDIVILSKTITGVADTFVDILMSQGIPAYCDTSEGYFNVREVKLILSMLTVIDNPLQDIPMAAVLLSYFGRMDTKELSEIRAADKRVKLYNQLKESDNQKAKAFLELLCQYREKSEYMSVYDLIWDVMYNTGYYDYVGTMPAGKRRQANLDILMEKARAYESTSYQGLFNFLRYIERLKKYNVELGEASLLGSNDNVVRIMSIHKSKGLEFPVVILTGMGKKFNHADALGNVIVHQELGIGADLVDLEKRTMQPTLIKNAISKSIIKEDISETMRVLYVAMTRAKEKFFITGTVSNLDTALLKWQRKAESIREMNRFTYADVAECATMLDMIMPVLYLKEGNEGKFIVHNENAYLCSKEVQTEEEDIRSDESSCDESEATQDFGILPPYPYKLDSETRTKITVSELKKMQYDADIDERMAMEAHLLEAVDANIEEELIIPKFLEDTSKQKAAANRGVAYHRIMECIDFGNSDIEAQLDFLLEQEFIDEEQKQCIRVIDIKRFCDSKLGQRVAKADMEKRLWREQPFVFLMDNGPDMLIQGVIDLYFIEDGAITVIDYKTDRVAKGKEGVDELINRYAVQLDYYSKALQQLTGLPVKERIIYSFCLGQEIIVQNLGS